MHAWNSESLTILSKCKQIGKTTMMKTKKQQATSLGKSNYINDETKTKVKL